MPIHRYPFIQLGLNDTPRPKLPVRIVNPHAGKELFTWALIDTGADMCAIPADMAKELGHNLEAVSPGVISTGAGSGKIFHHTHEISILRTDVLHSNGYGFDPETEVCHAPAAPVACSVGLNDVLLGVRGFLERYILTVNYQEKFFSVQNNHKY